MDGALVYSCDPVDDRRRLADPPRPPDGVRRPGADRGRSPRSTSTTAAAPARPRPAPRRPRAPPRRDHDRRARRRAPGSSPTRSPTRRSRSTSPASGCSATSTCSPRPASPRSCTGSCTATTRRPTSPRWRCSRCRRPPTGGALLLRRDRARGVRAAEELGLDVPGDLSVVGFDDSPLARRLRPQLTTVRQDVAEKGRTSAAELRRAMDAQPGRHQGPRPAPRAAHRARRARQHRRPAPPLTGTGQRSRSRAPNRASTAPSRGVARCRDARRSCASSAR